MMTRSPQVFTDIGQLVTMSRARKKAGRWIEEQDLSVIHDAAFVVVDGRIHWVGARKNLPRLKAQRISLQGAVVIPGLIDCHTHLVFAGDRSQEFELRMQGLSYQDIARRGGGIQTTVQATRKATKKDLLALARLREQRHLQQGVTTVEIKSGYGLNFFDEIKMLRVANDLTRIRVVPTFLGLHAVPAEYGSADDYVEDVIRKFLPKIMKQQLAQRVDVFIEKNYFNLSQTARYFSAAQKLGFDLIAHAEQLSRQGSTALVTEFSIKSMDHLVCANARDCRRLGQSDTTCVLLPASDFYLKIPYPPAQQLIKAGARVALATDFNPGSCPTQDIAFVGVLARQQMGLSLAQTLSAWTVGGAFALGLEHDLGSIEKGKCADFCVLAGPLSDLFYQVGWTPIHQVWRQGKKLV